MKQVFGPKVKVSLPKSYHSSDASKTKILILYPISTGPFCLVVALGGGVFSTPPSITPLSLKLDWSNFVPRYFQIG